VLRGFDLTLEPGKRIALVGPSGAGKSTVAALLVRFLDPAAGRITLDGVDVRDLRGDDVRQVVGYLGEDAYLFDTTVERNLRVARPPRPNWRRRYAPRGCSTGRVRSRRDSTPRSASTACCCPAANGGASHWPVRC
jgi:ABC-type multidrug transport system ATPase subunit